MPIQAVIVPGGEIAPSGGKVDVVRVDSIVYCLGRIYVFRGNCINKQYLFATIVIDCEIQVSVPIRACVLYPEMNV